VLLGFSTSFKLIKLICAAQLSDFRDDMVLRVKVQVGSASLIYGNSIFMTFTDSGDAEFVMWIRG